MNVDLLVSHTIRYLYYIEGKTASGESMLCFVKILSHKVPSTDRYNIYTDHYMVLFNDDQLDTDDIVISPAKS